MKLKYYSGLITPPLIILPLVAILIKKIFFLENNFMGDLEYFLCGILIIIFGYLVNLLAVLWMLGAFYNEEIKNTRDKFMLHISLFCSCLSLILPMFIVALSFIL